jgi:uncharacterized protein YlzI (FlbEa/FlbD family)
MLTLHDLANQPLYVSATHVLTVREGSDGKTVVRMLDGTELIVLDTPGAVVQAIILALE